MNARFTSWVAVCAGIAYVIVLSWAMTALTYDVWGVLVVVPPLAVIGAYTMSRVFSGELADLRAIMYVGLAVKLIGSALRYWVGFDAYQGGIDAQRYHDYAVLAASDLWAGRADFFSLLRGGTGTQFTEGITALIYAVTGTSKVAGFVVFSFLGFLGTAFFVKAACIAVPGLVRRRYAILCVLAPSLVYWPSSIGKDALLLFLLGLATYGIARLLSQVAILVPFLTAMFGLVGAVYIRPHIAGIWLAGAFPALLVALARGRDPWHTRTSRPLDRVRLIPVIVIAAVSLAMVALATVRYLDPGATGGDGQAATSSITSILDETSRRTEQAGSSFQPLSISSPTNWPYASIRTLTRPLPVEARGAAQLFTALETTIFLGLCALSWRRLANLPKLVVTYPYVAFAMTTMLLAGLAFTSFANLGVLARQRSIVVPFMLLVVCVPAIRRRPEHDPDHISPPTALREDLQNNSMSPRVNAQLASGGGPRSFTARHVRTGPPPGRGTNDDDIWG